MSSRKASRGKVQSAKSAESDKSALTVANDKNGQKMSADFDELSTVYKTDPIDHEKVEAFRRIASAEESEELDTFYNAADDVYDVSQDPDFANLDPQQKAKLEEEWRNELIKTEEEIQTLRQVLSAKVKQSHELKRKLGITVWKEFREDMEQGIKNIQETTASGLGIFSAPAYQKTTEAVKAAGEKTTSMIGSFGGSVARKLGEVKNSNAFKSFEERVGFAVTNVKTKMSGSRSNSTNSFEDALNNDRRTSQTSPMTSPTIPEDKPIS